MDAATRFGLACMAIFCVNEARAQYAPGLPFGPANSEYQGYSFPTPPSVRADGRVGTGIGSNSRSGIFDPLAADPLLFGSGPATPGLGPALTPDGLGAYSPYGATLRRGFSPLPAGLCPPT